MKNEKLNLTVGHAFELFLTGLEKPMRLNEMRIMKEPNYTKLRQLIRDPVKNGDLLIRYLLLNSDKLGIPYNSFHMVHESFWDLYCKKPAS